MITIRELKVEDYQALCTLWEAAGLPFKPAGRDREERIAQEINGPCSVFLAAEEDGELVGVVLGTHDGRKGWINRLAVLPSHRREGIATALVNAAEERFAALGIGIFTCMIEDWNESSMVLFDHLDYVRHDDIIYFSKRLYPDV